MIFLVRHGEAAAGWGDHPDPGLSDLGHKQAETVSAQLESLGATSVICSPMRRCQETAAPFAQELGVKALINPALSEILTPESVTDRVDWLRALMGGAWPEDMQNGWCRQAYNAVDALPDGSVVFSHFVAINAIIGQIRARREVLQFRPAHCSLTQVARDEAGKLVIKKLGDEAATKVL